MLSLMLPVLEEGAELLPVSILAATWVALVAASRLVLGVHWPTDVVAAACAGLFTAVVINSALSAYSRHRDP